MSRQRQRQRRPYAMDAPAHRKAVALYRLRKRAEGKCVKCGALREKKPSLCEACARKRIASSRRRRREWVAEGRCERCGKEPLPGLQLCLRCKRRDLVNQLRGRMLRGFKHEHRCYICGLRGHSQKTHYYLDAETADMLEALTLEALRRGGRL